MPRPREEILVLFAAYVAREIKPKAEPTHWAAEDVHRAKSYENMLKVGRIYFREMRDNLKRDPIEMLKQYRDAVVVTGIEWNLLNRMIQQLTTEPDKRVQSSERSRDGDCACCGRRHIHEDTCATLKRRLGGAS